MTDEATSQKQYLHDHNIVGLVDVLVHDLVQRKPEDPVDYLAKRFDTLKRTRDELLAQRQELDNDQAAVYLLKRYQENRSREEYAALVIQGFLRRLILLREKRKRRERENTVECAVAIQAIVRRHLTQRKMKALVRDTLAQQKAAGA